MSPTQAFAKKADVLVRDFQGTKQLMNTEFRELVSFGSGVYPYSWGMTTPPLAEVDEMLIDYNNGHNRRVISPCIHDKYEVLDSQPILILDPLLVESGTMESGTTTEFPITIPFPASLVALANRQVVLYNDFNRLAERYRGEPYNEKVLTQDKPNFSIWFPVVDALLLGGLYRQARRSVQAAHRFLKATSGVPATVRSVADSHLAYKFGLLPLLSDMTELRRISLLFMRWYVDTLDGLCARRYHQDEIVNETLWLDDDFSTAIGGVTLRLQKKTTLSIRRELFYDLTAPDMVSWGARFCQIVDRFGILDLSAAWDLIPFSFVLDWYVEIGSFLQDHSPTLSNLHMSAAAECRSHYIRTAYRWRVIAPGTYFSFQTSEDWRDNLAFDMGEGYSSPFMQRTTYQRYPARPAFTSSSLIGRGDGITISRISIVNALIAQRVSLVPLFRPKKRIPRLATPSQVQRHLRRRALFRGAQWHPTSRPTE